MSLQSSSKQAEAGQTILPLPYQPTTTDRRSACARSSLLSWILLPSILFTLVLHASTSCFAPTSSTSTLSSSIPICHTLPPLSTSSYLTRQSTLASTLQSLNASAYIAEPSPNTLYYFNVSHRAWHLSERPFLLALLTNLDNETEAEAETFVVVPSFEETRARTQLSIVGRDGKKHQVTYLPWKESKDPYAKLRETLDARGTGKIVVDEGMRAGIADELRNGLGGKREIIVSPKAVREIRERKTTEELALLKCANELTLHAIKFTREKIKIGMTESEVAHLLDVEALKVGIKEKIGSDGLILFGSDAALPHGGSTDRVLTKTDFVLIDVGATFRGYVADITRTFALPDSKIPQKHLDIWYLVQRAQAAAYAAVRLGIKASEIDEAARSVIRTKGLGDRFTHRLGHGIGLEGHEAPYLHAGNSQVTLLSGNSFSNEPGVYIEGEVGVRLEDCWYMDGEGHPVTFTPQASSPWEL